MTKQNSFCNWLEKFVEEKGIDLEHEFEVQGKEAVNFIPVGVIIDHIKITTPAEQSQIKDIIVGIDVINGDIYHFLEYLAKAIAV